MTIVIYLQKGIPLDISGPFLSAYVLLLSSWVIYSFHIGYKTKFRILRLLSTSLENDPFAPGGEKDDQDDHEDAGEGGDDNVIELAVLVIDPGLDRGRSLEVRSISRWYDYLKSECHPSTSFSSFMKKLSSVNLYKPSLYEEA